MDTSAVWEKVIVPLLVAVVIPFVIAYIRVQIAKVADEKLRALLDDLVAAAEQTIPKDWSKEQANDAKLKLVKAAAPKGTSELLIEAAVARLKGVPQ